MVVVDTSVWIDHYRGNATQAVMTCRALLREEAEVGLTDVIYMEVLQGAISEREHRELESQLLEFPILRLRGLGDFRLAAQLYRTARRAGITVRSKLDLMVAAACIREDGRILHSDADFDRLASCTPLRIYEPAA